jgi:hypothetical protein
MADGYMQQTAARGLIMSIDAFNNAIVDIDSVAGVLRILARLDFAAPASGEAVFVVPNGFSYIVNTSVEKTVAFTPMLNQFLPRAAHVRKPNFLLGGGASGKDGQKEESGKFLFHHSICLAKTTDLSIGIALDIMSIIHWGTFQVLSLRLRFLVHSVNP